MKDPIGTSLLWLFGIAVALIVLATAALSHEWYDAWCCNERDCAPIPFHAVAAGPDGWIVTLQPGEHPMADGPMVAVVPYDEMRVSQDGEFHACIVPSDGGRMRCLYGFVGG